MARGFRPVDRETGFLLPPDVREWLPEDHLAWTVIDAVESLDRTALIAAHPLGGRGRRAYDPTMMLTLLIYAYAVGVRSSRQIQARCEVDVAFRVITGNQHPDHDTIAAFRTRHREHFAALFSAVLRLCAGAGLARVGVISIDGTKLRANASSAANRTAAGIDTELARMLEAQAGEALAAAEALDAAEDAEHGRGRRGDEPPEGMRGREQRQARFAEAKARLEAQQAAEASKATEQYEQKLAEREAYRAAHGRSRPGPAPRPPAPVPPDQQRVLRVNTTDPDSRPMRTAGGFVQGFNAQAAVSDDQIILATDVVTDANDTAQLVPMTAAALANLNTAGIAEPVQTVLADTGYFTRTGLAQLDTDHQLHGGPEPLVPPDRDALRAPDQQTPHPQATPRARAMRERLADPAARQRYRRRRVTVEPVFGQIKNLVGDRLLLRGLDKARAEFTLIATAHNLRKLHTATR